MPKGSRMRIGDRVAAYAAGRADGHRSPWRSNPRDPRGGRVRQSCYLQGVADSATAHRRRGRRSFRSIARVAV